MDKCLLQGGVKDSHQHNNTEPEISTGSNEPQGKEKDLAFTYLPNIPQ